MASFHVINSGKTPARVEGIAALLMHITPDFPIPARNPLDTADIQPRNLAMVAGQESEVGFTFDSPITDAQYAAVWNRQARLILCARIIYRDQFQWRRKASRFTDFSFELDVEAGKRIGGILIFNVAEAFNDAS